MLVAVVSGAQSEDTGAPALWGVSLGWDLATLEGVFHGAPFNGALYIMVHHLMVRYT